MASIGTNEFVTFTAGRMNKSVDERILPEGEYIDALNIRIGSTESSSAGAIENSLGNTKLTNITFNGDPLSDDAECIGAYEDGANETIYWFVTDPTNVDMILSYNVRTQTLRYHVISVSVLNFDKQYRINSINLIDDLLFWTDNLNPPRKININRSYPYPSPTDNITEEDLNVIVAPPSSAPSIQLLNVAGEENYISDKFISFAYRYKYLDGEYSALSKFADIAFEPGVFSIDYSTYTNKAMENIFNTVKVSFDTGGDNVIGVDVCFKFSDSSVVNVIEKYNKSLQGWADNSTQEILFTNKKIYTALQESELLRLYDNVPRIAKTQTTMGNRLFYGNYVDGYDVVDENGDQINIDYTVNGVSDDIAPEVLDVVEVSGQDYTIDPLAVTSIADSGIEIDLTDVELKEGYTLVIAFNLLHNSFSGSSLYPTGAPLNQFQETFYFTFPRDYTSVFDLGTDQAFIDAVYNHQPIADCNDGFSLTDLFNCSLLTKSTSGLVPAWDKTGSGVSTNDGGFQIDVEAGSPILGIQVPAMEFSVEYPTGTMNYAYEYFENISTEAYLTLPKNNRSLHSNRDYELGIVYMDEYGRRSTALTCENNTVFFDADTSDQKNYINVSVNSIPPYWAKKYEFVLKPSKGGYETIFSNIFFIDDDGYTWFKLEGDNRSKVQENQNLIVKRDSGGVVNSLVKTKVLAIEAKSTNFIDDDVVEPSGTYMKLKASNFDAIFEENSFIDIKIKNAPGFPFKSYPISDTPLYEDNPNYDSGSPVTSTNTPYIPIAIPAGTLVNVVIRMSRNSGISGGCGSRYYRYDKSYVANEDYDSFYDFVEGQNISFTTGDTSGGDDTVNENVQYHNIVDYVPATISSATVPPIQGVNQYQFAEGYVDNDPMEPKDGRLYLVIRSGTPSCDDKGSYLSGSIEIQLATSTFIFETEPLEANGETFYEDGQVFDIIDGYHQGNITDQTSVFDSATSNLDFFNCFSFGNGCESYKIGDSLIGAPFYLGTRVTAVSQEDYKEAHRYASITYSGIYNEETNINKLNEFNLALANYKDLEKVFGPIEVLYGRKTDLLVLQEDKISYVLQGKNLLSDAAGGGAISSIPEILGTQISRIEENGISNNPESFTVYGSEIFFTDVKRSAVLNLRGGSYNSDNLVNISNQGMQYWFRDEFKNSLYNVKLGGYDPYMSEYVLSIKDDLLPIPETEIPCGVDTSFYNSNEPLNYGIDFGKMIGDATISFNVTEGDIDVVVTYDGAEIFNGNIDKPDSVVVSKDNINEQIVYVDINPNDATFSVDSDCLENDEVTVFNIVLNSPSSEGQTIHTKYRWASGSTVSSYETNFITMSGTGVSLNESSTGMISEGLIPAEGSDVSLVSQKVTGDTYDFTDSNKFKYLSSNTLYDVPTLIPLLNTITPTLNPSTGVYQGDINAFSYLGQYLYLVWDLRISESVLLCYSEINEYDVCCNCLTPTEYFMDATDFTSATTLYTDASLSTVADDGYYGIDGIVRRLKYGELVSLDACQECEPCIPWVGGTFKGEGGFTATFEYIDCETKEVMNAEVSIPENLDPNTSMAYTVSPSICAVQNSVQLLSPTVPYITYEYTGSCAEDFCNNITIEVLVSEDLTFNITPCGGSPEDVVLNNESYSVCVQSINSIPTGTGTKFNIYLVSPC